MTALCSDTFNRADSTTNLGSTDGANAMDARKYLQFAGTWGISSNRAYCSAANASGAATVECGTGDVDISVTLAVLGTAGSRSEGITFRGRQIGSSGSMDWKFRLTGTSTLTLTREIGITYGTATVSVAAGDVMRVVAIGPIIKCYYNGVLKFQVVSGISQYMTRHGLACGNTVVRFDSFTISSPSIGAVYSQDAFDRTGVIGSTDGNGTADPLAWAASVGDAFVTFDVGQHNYANAQGPATLQLATVDPGVADCAISLGYIVNGLAGIVFRYTDASNYLFVTNETAGSIRLYKRVAGVNTQLGVSTGYSTNTDVALKVICDGTSVKVYRYGVLIISVTESHNSTATRCGMYADTAAWTKQFDNWLVFEPIEALAGLSLAAIIGGRGFYVDQVTMGPGSPILTEWEPDWASGPSVHFVPFYDSNYGVMVMPKEDNGATDVIPASSLWLYRIDIDPLEPTGYKFNLLSSGYVNGYNRYVRASGAWFSLVGDSFELPLNDRQIVFSQYGTISGGPYSVAVLTRNANNTLSWKADQLVTGTGGSVTHKACRYDDTRFARGFSVTATRDVQGVAVTADGTCSVVSTSSVSSPEDDIIQYDYQHNCLLGNLLGSATVWARAWTPGGGYTGARVNGTLPFTSNNGPTDGFVSEGAESSEMMLRRTSGTNMYASFNGTTWTIGSPSSSGFPFPQANGSVFPYETWQHYGKWMTAGKVNDLTPSFRLDYALTSQNVAVPALAFRRSTGITYANYGYQGLATGTPLISVARHGQQLALVFGSFTSTVFASNAFARRPIAFSTSGAPAADVLLTFDTFNRADGLIGSTDGDGTLDPLAWVAQVGTWNILSNLARASVVTAPRSIATLDLGTADVDIIVVKAASDINGQSIIFRYVDASNYLLLLGDQSTLYISKMEAGVLSNLSGDLGDFFSGDILRIQADGTALTAYKNTVQLGQVASSFNLTATKHGMGAQGTGQRFDSFSARTL